MHRKSESVSTKTRCVRLVINIVSHYPVFRPSNSDLRGEHGVIRVLHLIEGLSSGGASRNLLTMAKFSSRIGDVDHRVASLDPASQDGITLARDTGITVLDAPNHARLTAEAAQ